MVQLEKPLELSFFFPQHAESIKASIDHTRWTVVRCIGLSWKTGAGGYHDSIYSLQSQTDITLKTAHITVARAIACRFLGQLLE